MSSLREYRLEQLTKLNQLRQSGLDLYPSRVQRDISLSALRQDFAQFEGESKWLTGRLLSLRQHGQITFLDVADQDGSLQLIVRQSALQSARHRDNQLKYGDLNLLTRGDFLNAGGIVKKSERGEMSLEVSELRILAKVLRPLPLKLEDVGTRRRRRYLDTAINPAIRQRFLRRSHFWQNVRDFLNRHGFSEINIPVLEHTTGGAEATPFKTHMKALGEDFYLRISHELPLKKLLGGGYEKIYDLGPRFRNENYSDEHLPEHIALEWYWAYADWQSGMELMEEMFAQVSLKTFATQQFKFQGKIIDFQKRPWPKIDYAEVIAEHYGIDVLQTDLAAVHKILKANNLEVGKITSLPAAIDKLFKNIRTSITGPCWLVNPPTFMSPLSKENPEKRGYAQRFQGIIAGSELCNGFSELNDPQEQLKRMREQQARRDQGDKEAQMLDIDFIEMLEYGMPPACGVGFSERVFWSLEGVAAREGVPFNHLRFEIDPNTKDIYPGLFK